MNEIALRHVLSEKTMNEVSANLSFRSQMGEQEGASRWKSVLRGQKKTRKPRKIKKGVPFL